MCHYFTVKFLKLHLVISAQNHGCTTLNQFKKKKKDKTRSKLHLWRIYVKTPPGGAAARFAAMINKSVEPILIFINKCITWQGIITHSKFFSSAPDSELLNSGIMSMILLDMIPLIDVSSIR